MPLRDVTITENYSSTEREERLLAAKKIIDLNLTEFTLNEILKSYSDILNDTEITQAKSLLSELQSNKNQQTTVNQLTQPTKKPSLPKHNDAWDD